MSTGGSHKERPSIIRTLVAIAAIVIIIAGAKSANEIISPIVFSAFLAILITPALGALQNKGLSFAASLIIIIIITLAIGFMILLFLNANINELQNKLPEYERKFTVLAASIGEYLSNYGARLPKFKDLPFLQLEQIAPFLARFFIALINSLSSLAIVFILLVFILSSAPTLSRKMHDDILVSKTLVKHGADFTKSVRSFMWVSTLDNIFVAVLFTPFLLILGVDFAFLWGFLALILSYIPTIGLVLAATPAVMVALIEQGLLAALLVVVGAVVINFIGDNIFMPRVAAKTLSISPLIVILSFIIWTWIFGILGGLFSVPLTLALKTMLESYPETRWIADAMVEESTKSSDETPGKAA